MTRSNSAWPIFAIFKGGFAIGSCSASTTNQPSYPYDASFFDDGGKIQAAVTRYGERALHDGIKEALC